MPDVTKETITTTENSDDATMQKQSKRDATSYQTAGYLIYFIFGVLDVLLVFRFVFLLLGANQSSGFVNFIYNLSAIFVAPFAGIFNTTISNGNITASVFEPATLVAFIVYGVLAWGLVAFVRVISGRQQQD